MIRRGRQALGRALGLLALVSSACLFNVQKRPELVVVVVDETKHVAPDARVILVRAFEPHDQVDVVDPRRVDEKGTARW